MFSATTIRRFAASCRTQRSFAVVLSVALLLPNFACRCADGREIPFCMPGACGRCVAPGGDSASPVHSCCGKRSGCQCCTKSCDQGTGDGFSAPGSCCQLVIHAKSGTEPAQKVQLDLHQPIIHLFAVEPLPGLIAAVTADWNRPFDIEQGPPPVDYVITQLCLTL